jgi:UMF1 family MFS transporter
MKLTRPILSWSLYDFADTAFTALFVTFFFPILIRRFLGGTEFQVGLALGLSLLAGAFLVPLLGAFADALGRRLPIMAVSTLVTAALTAATGFAGLTAALVLGFLANLFNTLNIDLYDSFIPDLAPPESRGRLAGLGTAIGYLGAIGALGAAYAVLSQLGFETEPGVRAIFPLTAGLFVIFAIPLFLFVRDKRTARRPIREAAPKAFAELRFTLTHLRRMRGLGPFLLASFLYNDAMHTAIIFLSLYGTIQIGLTIQQFFLAFAIMALAAFGGALVFGRLSDRIKPRQTITGILLGWIIVILGLAIFPNPVAFVLAGSVGGALLGGIWTCNRHMVTLLAPPHKIAEIFGIEGLTEKVAGVLGPIVFGFLATKYGYTPALLSLLLFFGAGLFILRRHVPADV